MSESTSIEWCDSTFNGWMGCTKISPACDHCYAERDTARFGRVQWGAGAPRVRTSPAYWKKPLRWNQADFQECGGCGWRGEVDTLEDDTCRNCGKHEHLNPARRRVFCSSLADVFDNEVGPTWRGELFRLIAQTPNLDWLLLTKRIGNAERMIADAIWWPAEGHRYRPLPNVWLGATIANRAEMLRDAEKLRSVPAALRFWSVEPMLGDLGRIPRELMPDWVIAGGESGPHARPMHPDWIRSLRDQCAAAGVPFLFKQWGEWAPDYEGAMKCADCGDTKFDSARRRNGIDECSRCGSVEWTAAAAPLDKPCRVGKKKAGRLLDGVEHNAFPVSHG